VRVISRRNRKGGMLQGKNHLVFAASTPKPWQPPPAHPLPLVWLASSRPQWLRMMEGRMAAGT
jgi:hypothetical protein